MLQLFSSYEFRFQYLPSLFLHKKFNAYAFTLPALKLVLDYLSDEGGLNKKKIQLNICNRFSILIFIELYLFT